MRYFLLLLLHPLFTDQRVVHTTLSELRAVDLVEKASGGAGEPCGFYTLRCAAGLRCVPPKDDPELLRALLEGRGRCGSAGNISTTQASRTTDTAPIEASEQAPCRRLLMAHLSALGPQRIRPQQEVYLPNCDREGFFKRRQCWSSRGRQRGRCWCVDENGTPLTSNSTQKSSDC